jgi:hypothetical protein
MELKLYRRTTWEIEMLGETVGRIRAILVGGNYSRWRRFPQRSGNLGWELYAYGNWMRAIHNPWIGMGYIALPPTPPPTLPLYPTPHDV